MKVRLKFWILGFGSLILMVCASNLRYHNIRLINVEKSGTLIDSISIPSISVDDTGSITVSRYEDERIEISWFARLTSIQFEIRNKGQKSLKIIWDDAAYVDVFGTSQKVSHSGVKYLDANESHPPSLVLPQTYYSDIIVPTSNIEWGTTGWEQKPLFFYARGTEVNGKSIRILLPVEIDGQRSDLIFNFLINQENESAATQE